MSRIPLSLALSATIAVTVLAGTPGPAYAEDYIIYVSIPRPIFDLVPLPHCVRTQTEEVTDGLADELPPPAPTVLGLLPENPGVCIRPQ